MRLNSIRAAAMAACALMMATGTALAADKPGCKAPFWAPQKMPGFDIDSCTDSDYASLDVSTVAGDKTLLGHRTTVNFTLVDQSKNPKNATAWQYFVQAAQKAGAKLMSSLGGGYNAVLSSKTAKGEFWFTYDHGSGNENSTGSYTLTTLQVGPAPQLVQLQAVKAAPDPQSKQCANPNWVVKLYPQYKLGSCDGRVRDSVQVDLKDGQKTLEGARTTVSYELKDNATAETDLALKTNFIQAFKAMGATVVSDPVKSDDVVAMEKTPLGEFWLLYSRGSGNSDGRGSFSLVTVQVTPFAQEVQTQPMKAALDVSAKCGDPAWLVKQFAQYKLASCECRYWDAVQLSLPGGAKKLEGVRSTVTYSLTDDKKTDTALNVQKNYLQALKASGATIVSDPGNADQVVATQKSAAGEFWFIYDHGSGNDESTSSYSLTTVQIVQFPQIVQARPEPSTPAPEAAKCQGPAWLVKQFPYYNATQCNTRDFDSITLDLPSGKKTLAGRVQITDFAPANPNIVATQIYAYKNYVNALTGIGAKQVSDPNNPSTAIFTQSTPQGEFWYIYGQSSGNAEGVSYELTTVQIGGPPPKTCTLEIYGVNFDFNKSTLRPDSEPVLQQVLALFNADPSFGGEIGGHTDNVGTRAYNMKLSASRAEAVKAWLVAHGVAASRMTTAGYADTRPLVPNTTDANRFKNRRVELKRSHCK